MTRHIFGSNVMLLLLAISCGCMSISERHRAVQENLPPAIYPGVRAHAQGWMQFFGGDVDGPDREFRWVLISPPLLAIVLADGLALSPALDTLLSPYDGLRILLCEKPEKIDVRQERHEMNAITNAITAVVSAGADFTGQDHTCEKNETKMGTHHVMVKPHSIFTSSSSTSNEVIRVYQYSAGKVSVTVRNDELIVNDTKYGKLAPGESILVDYGKVSVAGQPRQALPMPPEVTK